MVGKTVAFPEADLVSSPTLHMAFLNPRNKQTKMLGREYRHTLLDIYALK